MQQHLEAMISSRCRFRRNLEVTAVEQVGGLAFELRFKLDLLYRDRSALARGTAGQPIWVKPGGGNHWARSGDLNLAIDLANLPMTPGGAKMVRFRAAPLVEPHSPQTGGFDAQP